jgi:hypothetical protein
MAESDERERSKVAIMIGDAQEHAHHCQETALAAHAGTTAVGRARAERDLHVAVMSYWALLQRFQSETQLSDKWRLDGGVEDGVDPDEWTVAIDGQQHTLADLGAWRFRTREVVEDAGGPIVGERVDRHHEPETLPMSAAIDVLDLLDRVAHELGFTASTEDVTPHTEADHEDVRTLAELRDQDTSGLPGGDA